MNYPEYNGYTTEYDECACGRGDGCDCDGHEEKARADEEEGKRANEEYWGDMK